MCLLVLKWIMCFSPGYYRREHQPHADAVTMALCVSRLSERFYGNRKLRTEERGDLSRWFDGVIREWGGGQMGF